MLRLSKTKHDIRGWFLAGEEPASVQGDTAASAPTQFRFYQADQIRVVPDIRPFWIAGYPLSFFWYPEKKKTIFTI